MSESEKAQATLELAIDAISYNNVTWRAGMIVDLSLITILIDAGLLTAEAAIERIRLIQGSLGRGFLEPDVTAQVEKVLIWLQAHAERAQPRWTPEVLQGGLSEPGHQASLPPEEEERS